MRSSRDGTDSASTVLVAFGTRPEAIKMAPVVRRLQDRAPEIRTVMCVTAQHREMLDQVLTLFRVSPDYDLGLMQPDQALFDVTSTVLRGMRDVLHAERPDVVLVQGDTTTTFAAALAAYYLQIPVGHIEAGLRTHDRYHPFPEEMNRRLTDDLSTFLFAPTDRARRNLLAEGAPEDSIFVTGNTGIDALLMTVNREYTFRHAELKRLDFARKKVIVVTAHRRESLGAPLEAVCAALRRVVEARPDVDIVFPVHLNPHVQQAVRRVLHGVSRVHLLEPLDYEAFVQLLDRCCLILTDSGGIQEEAPSLGKPVLVLRERTERPEAVEAGTAELVGTDPEWIVNRVERLLDDPSAYAARAVRRSPFGDGRAADRIVAVITAALAGAATDPFSPSTVRMPGRPEAERLRGP